MLLKDEGRNSKHVLIADGVGNAGREMVASFTGRGARVAFLYRERYREALELARNTGALNVKCNIYSPESLASAGNVVKEFFEGHIDTLICNPGLDEGILRDANGWQLVPLLFQRSLEGFGFYIYQMLPMMKKSGSIILILPKKEETETSERIALRTLQKGLEEMITAASEELWDRGVRINGIRVALAEQNGDAVANTARFLASGDAAAITGQIIDL